VPITATVDTPNAGVQLFVDFATETGTHTTATVYRHVGALTATGENIRGVVTTLLGEQAYIFDHETPLDVQVWYSAVSNTGLTVTTGPVTLASNGYVWIKDPGRPWADLRLDLCVTPSRAEVDESCTEIADPLAWVGFRDKTRAVDAGLFDILDAERPADVYARRKDIVTGCLFLSRTLASLTAVYDLYTVGGPVFTQVPSVYGMQAPYGQTDRYWQPGDLAEDYISQDQRKPVRLWSVPLTAVDMPVGEAQGTDTANWCVIEDTYQTMGDLAASGYTWGQVATGAASTPPPSFDGYGGGAYGSGPYGD
jgi:hypothetical protein